MAFQIAPAWASMFHLVSITIERHIAITKPLVYHKLVTPVRLTAVVTVNNSVAWQFVLVPLAWPRDQFPLLCMSVLWYPKTYIYPVVVVPMAIKLFIVLLLYVHIFSIARKQETAIAAAASTQNGGECGPRSLKATSHTSIQVHLWHCSTMLFTVLDVNSTANNDAKQYFHHILLLSYYNFSSFQFWDEFSCLRIP